MAIYQSMQRVRFSSPDDYRKFMTLFAGTRDHLKKLPGFLHLTWWVHADDPCWFNEVSMWTSETSSVTGLAEPEEVPALLVTNRLLPILDVQPAVGRRFTPADP